jgi:23S rRNA pseudouridine1911/1915/1917 synthase
MNKNEVKTPRNQKGLVDPKSIKEFKVYVETTLLEFLLFKMTGTSRNTVKSLLSHHLVAVDGVPVSQFDYKLYPEDTVIVSKRPIHKRKVAEFKILLEDEDIIAIDKPSGLLSVATDREKGKTAFRMVSDYYREKNPKGRIHLVHRLDQDTSGLLVLAKTPEVYTTLQSYFQRRDILKRYEAVVKPNEGVKALKSEGVIDLPLLPNPYDRPRQMVDRTHGNPAITRYVIRAQQLDGTLLVDFYPFTGRTHQLRVHAAL